MRRERITRVSPEGIVWLALLEGGMRLDAYQDGAGVWTISAGVTFYGDGTRVKKGDKLKSVQAAEDLFRARLSEFEGYVDAYTRDDITQTVFDGMASACFNIGVAAFRTSTFLKRFNDRSISMQSVVEALGWFNKKMNPTNGKLEVDAGLSERRRCEAYLLLFGLYRTQGQPKEPPVEQGS